MDFIALRVRVDPKVMKLHHGAMREPRCYRCYSGADVHAIRLLSQDTDSHMRSTRRIHVVSVKKQTRILLLEAEHERCLPRLKRTDCTMPEKVRPGAIAVESTAARSPRPTSTFACTSHISWQRDNLKETAQRVVWNA